MKIDDVMVETEFSFDLVWNDLKVNSGLSSSTNLGIIC